MTGDLAVASRSRARARSAALPPGGSLDLAATLALMKTRRARLVVLAGSVGTGKTTLVSAIYEAFGAGPAFALNFAGSDTLLALEQRCHEARLSSGLEVAQTPRTPRVDPSLTHLAVAPVGTTSRTHIFLSDLSGEIYRDVIATPSLAAGLEAIMHAHRIQLLLDGGTLLRLGRRDVAIYELGMLARSIAEFGLIGQETLVDVAITKTDLLAGQAKALAYGREAADAILRSVPAPNRGRVFEICARSTLPGQTPSLEGVAALVEGWSGIPNAREQTA